MLRHLIIPLLCTLIVASVHGDDPTIQLIAGSEPLSPNSTLEIRFSDEMVTADQLGKPADFAPILLHPDVPGKFTWVSSRSGIFSPTQPYPLGTALQVDLRHDLKTRADGELPENWTSFVTTPPFAVQAWSALSYLPPSDAPAEPSIALLFNDEVRATDVAPHCWFERAGGTDRIAAVVEPPTVERPGISYFGRWLTSDRSLIAWADRFRGADFADTKQANQLFVSPAKPLPPGEGWRLTIKSGIPSTDSALRTLANCEIPIGTVRPFEVGEVSGTNDLGNGRRIVVTFTKALARDLKPESLARWACVTPPPAGYKAEIAGSTVTFTGEFELQKPYRISIQPGLAAEQPFVLAGGVIEDVIFAPIAPELRFEAFETHQMNAGQRRFHLRAVNVPKVTVTAKLFSDDTVPIALRGFDPYYNSPRDSEGRALPGENSRINPDTLPGRVIWQQELPVSEAMDESTELALDWNEILGPNRTGTVLLTAEQAGELPTETLRPGAQAIVQVTDLAAVWKRAAQETFVHIFSMKSGQAVAGASLRLLDDKDAALASAKTDGQGIAQLPPATAARWLEVKTETDQHLIEIKNGSFGIDLARVNVDFDEDAEPSAAAAMRAYLFTERGVYKPGETVHLKGIARDSSAGEARVTPGLKGRLVVRDGRGREFINREITLSDFGSFAEDLKLPKNAVGSFFVEVKFGKGQEDERSAGSHSFEVQDYRPNAFEIAIGQPPTTPGSAAISLPVTAKYYMGKSLSKARLTWSVDARDTPFSPDAFRDFDFTQAIDNYRLNRELDRLSQFSEQGEADLDEGGRTSLNITVPLNAKAPQPRSVRVLCEITDLNQQTVSETRNFTQHSSDFYLGVRRFRSLVHENEALPLEIIAVRTDGTPVPEPVEGKLQLTRIDWQTNRVQTAGGATSYQNEPRFELVTRRDFRTSPLAKEGRLWIASPLPEALSVEQPGQYLLEVSARDSAGREVVTATTFQVYGAGATAWDYRNPYQIELVPDKDDYAAGETATILVKTPISGDALVTIEREKVRRSFITHLDGNAPAITVPLEADDAPNVFVSVMLLRGAADSPRKIPAPEYRIGYCELTVARPDSKLTVYVQTDATAYRPADEVTVNAEVLDFAGHPVAGAEVTLYAVDEGVLSLTGYETPNPIAFFNQRGSLGVSTSLTLPTLLDEDPEHRGFENKGFLVGDGGDGGDDRMRKNFLACAFWAADLITDELGKISARFPAPDSLTRYRVIAVVQSRRNQFGAGESAFEVNKPVMLEPSLPRFANVSDRLALRAVVHNTTDQAGRVAIALALDDKARADETTRTIELPAHGSVAVDFPVEFIEVGKATWKWTADFTGEDGTKFGDVVQSELKVGFPAPLLREVRIFKNRGFEPNVLANVDPRILEGRGTVRVSVANSRAIEIQEALRQLLHYPYGCVEQTTSSTLPWLTLRDFQNLLPSLQRTEDEIDASVQHGVDRLLSMQTSSGGLSYWPGAPEPMLWGSAYGSIALTLARQQGRATVPDEDYERLMSWMSGQLRGTADLTRHYDLSPRCLAVYALALAGRAEPAYAQTLFERRENLAGDDRALLALAIAESKGSSSMIDELLKSQSRTFDDDWFALPARSTALQLLAWNRYRPQARQLDALANELFQQQRGGHWWTTQGNAWALLAMGDYLQRNESSDKSATARVHWGDVREDIVLGAKPETVTRELPIVPAAASAPFQIEKTMAGALYSEVTIEAFPKLAAQPAQDRGYAITRNYSKVDDDGSLSEANDLRVGDRVLVTLEIEVRKVAGYLAIEDPLPSVFEPLNPAFKSQATRVGENLGREFVSDYRELRDDRALFFANYLQPGRYTLRYLARVIAAGAATAPSAKIEEMYHPERFGLTASASITTSPLK